MQELEDRLSSKCKEGRNEKERLNESREKIKLKMHIYDRRLHVCISIALNG